MSKRNLFLGTAAGKVGDVVVYRAGGTQRARVRVVPKDPKTSAQMIQRSRIGGVVATYRAAKGLLQDTFESKPSKQSAYNAFAQEALPTAPVMRKPLVDAGCAFPMPMTISRGSLPNPFQMQGFINGNLSADIDGTVLQSVTTIKALSEELIRLRPCCFKNGSEIIACVIQYVRDETLGNNYYKPLMTAAKFTLDTGNTDEVPVDGVIRFAVDGGTLVVSVHVPAGVPCVAALLVANTDAEGIHVTNADGYMNTEAETLYTTWTSSTREQEVAESYGASGSSCVI